MECNNVSGLDFKKVPIKDELAKVSGDVGTKKIMDKISKEISPSELEDGNEDYIRRNMGGLFL